MNKDQNQLNSEADVVKSTTTTTISDSKQIQGIVNNPTKYYPQAIPTTIKFSSRASIKITSNGQDHYYTVEYGEEREIQDFDEVNLEKERQLLIDDCNAIVDKQAEEIYKTFMK